MPQPQPDDDPGGPGAPPPPASRAKRERVAQACENCRAQKAKCKPSTVAGTCEKCLRTQKRCVPHIPKAASVAGRGKRRSLAKMESRIEALYELINKAGPEAQKSLRDVERGLSNLDEESDGSVPPEAMADEPFEATARAVPASSTSSTTRLAEDWQSRAVFMPPIPSLPTLQALSADQTISQSEKLTTAFLQGLDWPRLSKKENYFKLSLMLGGSCEQLLNIFDTLLPYFPFVNLRRELPVIELIHEQPYLVTAIMVATSSHNKALQRVADDLFRNAIAEKAIIQGQKSLDMVQGLLIYVAWHHLYFNIETQQVATFAVLATSMVLDLGFDRRYRDNRRQNAAPEPIDVHGLRALLGCYYTCTITLALTHNKTIPLQWSPILEHCAAEVARVGTLPWDRHMPAMVSLFHIAEDIRTSLRSPNVPLNTSSCPTNDSDIRIMLYYSHLDSRLRAWDTEFAIKDLIWLTPTRHFLSIFLFESALLPANIANTSLSPARHHDLLIACLSSARLFLDGALASPALIIDSLNIGAWAHFLAAIFAVARLSRPMPPEIARAVHWDYSIALTQVNLSQYIDALISRMREQAAARPYTKQTQLVDWFTGVALRIVGELGTFPEEGEVERVGNVFNSIRHYAEKSGIADDDSSGVRQAGQRGAANQSDGDLGGNIDPAMAGTNGGSNGQAGAGNNHAASSISDDLLFWDSFMGVGSMAEFGLF